MKKLVLLAALLVGGLSLSAQTNNLAGSPIPTGVQEQLPNTAMAAFNTNGLSFTNVTYKVALGTEMLSGSGGSLMYVQADIDAFKFKSFDIGFGLEATKSTSNNGFHNGAVDLEFIKNFPNWQLVGKAGYGRNFETPIANYAEVGLDVNYNLTAGANLPILGFGVKGAFTYVFGGVKWGTSDFSFKQASITKQFTVGLGYAF